MASHLPHVGGPPGRMAGLGRFVRCPLNWLLLFIPVALILERTEGAPAALRFGAAAFAILPLALLLITATEQIARRTSQAIGGLLNATFGNAPEFIIAGVALRDGQIDLVRAAIVGGILGNLLFTLGLAFFVGGVRHHVQEFNPRGARIQTSMLLIASISLIVPSVFHNFMTPETLGQEQDLSDAVAAVLLIAYGLSLVFMLKTHPDYYASGGGEQHEGGSRWSVGAALTVLIGSAIALALVSEVLVGSAGETATSLGMSKAFVGIIFLALLGGFAECMAAVVTARRNQMDLSIGIAVGSSIQIAMFVAPALVLLSGIIGPTPLNLIVGNAGSVVILLAVLIAAMVCDDGESNWFKGLQLLVVYVLFALFCFFLPDSLVAASSAP